MTYKFTGPDDPKIVDAILERMGRLTRDEIIARLTWTPEGLEHLAYIMPDQDSQTQDLAGADLTTSKSAKTVRTRGRAGKRPAVR
jgi:hypothetical protein